MDFLPTLWFVIIAVLWAGYLFLEGFDLGVGMLLGPFARREKQRRLLINTVGPVWDGNEVWLITAAGATFAAFPHWYASLFAAMYVPLVVVLLALIFRAVAFEYRGKAETAAARRLWTIALSGGSLVIAFGVGVLLAVTTTGLPLNANGDRVGGPFAWLTWPAVLGGLAVVGFCLAQALAFLALKTDGDVRVRSARLLARWFPVLLAPLVAWVAVVVAGSPRTGAVAALAVAAAAAAAAWAFAARRAEGRAFLSLGVFLLASVAALFTAAYPVVLPSTIDPAFDLTVANASSSAYTLQVMSIVAAFGLPLVLGYQAWTYWVFRRRMTEDHIPDAHAVTRIV
ncbi:cytochrome d ubiquinol oxidase subunit II [Zhihengliuella salsuginis]|uniref:Cytochrome c oxidase assembly protein n=1 Tax=Zhihengliuella salsuginis TaxID=578222 RepID=A0ABQ3GDA5_9MICC|nr:cytochrome d ubiquinol oxidase subunit II [Zhihengliuella salsuginis]GHD01140.1 cytochrome c oxidase assembly protein [Zhihengliuella salsuginis]